MITYSKPPANFQSDAQKETQKQKGEINSRLSSVKKKIAVWSGKGGVGKTFFSVQLAYGLKKFTDKKVALFDADIDCPNIAKMLGVSDKLSGDQTTNTIYPVIKDGLEIVSMGTVFRKDDETVIWRGPMISQTITSFLVSVKWASYYLVVDLPPGTSDAPLTIAQQLLPDGLIIVSTSDPVAMADAKRSLNFAKTMKIPVVGIVENMAGDIFGTGGVEKLAKETGIKFLGSIPLSKKIRKYVSDGKPLCETREFGKLFEQIVKKIE